MDKIRQDYNKLLERHDKAAAYLDNSDILLAEKEKWTDEYKKIIRKLSDMLIEIYNYTQEEAMYGFKE